MHVGEIAEVAAMSLMLDFVHHSRAGHATMVSLWALSCLTVHYMLHEMCTGSDAEYAILAESCTAGTFCLWLGSSSPREVVTRPLLSAA